MFSFLSIFWFIRTTKFILFYLYLWQLKEYHLGRFLDHFRTEKGKRVLFNKLKFLKIVFLIYFLSFFYFFSSSPSLSILYSLLPAFILIFYFAESLKTFKDFFQKKLKFPVFTKKIAFLISVLLIFEVLIVFTLLNFESDLNFFVFWLLFFDIFTSVFTSAIVLIFQPLTLLIRNQMIRQAKKKRDDFKDLLVIGITGSYGKSSTKEFLYTILSEKATREGGASAASKVLKTKEHQNSEAGISQCILNDLKPEHEIFIVEMGAYGRGGIKLLCDITRPRIGILMGANEQHLALFSSMENIISAEGGKELIESLPENGLAIFNGDNKYCLDLYQTTKKQKRLCLSIRENRLEADLWAENIIPREDFVFFKACDSKGCSNFKAYVAGTHFIPNLLAAILVAKELGMSMEEIAQACLKIKPMEKTMEILKGKHGLTIIDDSYSANPNGVISALEYLKMYSGKKIIVLSCLIELGAASKEIHRKIGEKIGDICDAAIITTKERFEEIKKGAIIAGLKKDSILFSENPEQISEIIKEFFHPGDVVLLEGRVPEKLIQLLI